MKNLYAFAACAFLACVAGVGAQGTLLQPSPPPGKIAQNVRAFLAGAGVRGPYRIVTSRANVGKLRQQQWYLSIYAPGAANDLLRIYQSPASDDRLGIVPKLEQGHGTDRYFPTESVTIIGKGELMGEARDQALVLVRARSADCGEATLSILDAFGGAVHVDAQISNPCALEATISNSTVLLRGPYYNESAPLCCPTKANAVAVLRYANGRWFERPQYFKLSVPRQAAPAVTPLTHVTPLFTPYKSIITSPKPSGVPMPPKT